MKTTTTNLLNAASNAKQNDVLALIPRVNLDPHSLQYAAILCIAHGMFDALDALRATYPDMIYENTYLRGFINTPNDLKMERWETLLGGKYINLSTNHIALRSWVGTLSIQGDYSLLANIFQMPLARKSLNDDTTRKMLLMRSQAMHATKPEFFGLLVDFYGFKTISMHLKMLSKDMLEELFAKGTHEERLILEQRCQHANISVPLMTAYKQKMEMLQNVGTSATPISKPRVI